MLIIVHMVQTPTAEIQLLLNLPLPLPDCLDSVTLGGGGFDRYYAALFR